MPTSNRRTFIKSSLGAAAATAAFSERLLAQAGVSIAPIASTKLADNLTLQEVSPMPKEGRPTKTFYTTGSMKANGEKIAYGHMLQAHTDGDIYIYFSKSNVLALGGLTSANAWPLIDWWTGGWIGGLPTGLETAAKVANADTRIVPASGPAMTFAELQAQTQMYRTISTRLQQLMRKGRSADEALATEPAKEFVDKMGNPSTFLRRAFESCWGQLSPDA